MKKYALFLIITLLLSSQLYSQNPGLTGSFGLFYTHMGKTFSSGRYGVFTNANYYAKSSSSVMAGNFAFTAGVMDNLDITLASRLYQTAAYLDGKNGMNDVFVTIKAGSFSFEKGRFVVAILGTGRIPLGDSHNYPFSEYASGAFEFGIKGAASYFVDPYLPQRSFSIHYNFGYWNHNEKGKEIPVSGDSTLTALHSSSKIDMALSAVVPLSTFFDLRFEIYGYLYTSIPPSFVYSAEDYATFTPSIRYRATDWMSLDLGVDIRLSSGERQRTSGVPPIEPPLNELSSYPPWRMQFALNFNLTPGKKNNSFVESQAAEVQKMTDFYDMLEREKEKSKRSETKTKKLRQERKQTEAAVQVIKHSLEGED